MTRPSREVEAMLDPQQWPELLALMRAARDKRLGADQEMRLRWFVAKMSPSAQFLPLADVYETGLFMLGLRDIEQSFAR